MAAANLRIDPRKETARITGFITDTVRSSGSEGAVVALSGGVDSAVAGALCVRALGRSKVFALLLPSESTPSADVDDARLLAQSWGAEFAEVRIGKLVSGLRAAAKIKGSGVADANLQARVRMTILYYYTNTMGYLACGTGDRSESEIGYFTKWGDGGVDFLPIAHLYKTQVRMLGAHLGLPDRIVQKPASPQLWPGHKATDEIPVDYDRLDVVLNCLFDRKMDAATASSEAGVSLAVVKRALELHRKTMHKRTMPPSLAQS